MKVCIYPRESANGVLGVIKYGGRTQEIIITRAVVDKTSDAFDQVHLSLKSSGIQAPFWSNSKKYTRPIF
jgi:hypothetical protein